MTDRGSVHQSDDFFSMIAAGRLDAAMGPPQSQPHPPGETSRSDTADVRAHAQEVQRTSGDQQIAQTTTARKPTPLGNRAQSWTQ